MLVFRLPATAQDGAAAQLPPHVEQAQTLVRTNATPELGFDIYHAQGLVVTGDFYYLTGVDKHTTSAWIFKVDRATNELVKKSDISKIFAFHPSGIDYDGKYIWVAVAVYIDHSYSYMMTVDPDTLQHKTRFKVDDHIGAVARVGDLVIGGNWGCEEFYFYTRKGELLEKRPSPTGVGYQDCNGVGRYMMCTGFGYLDWIDVDKWQLAKRFEVGESDAGSTMSREGTAYYDGRAYFLPDDGPEAKIYEFEFE